MLAFEKEDDEKYWYGFGGWRSLRTELYKIGGSELPVLLQDLSQQNPDVPEAVSRFIVRMVQVMRSRHVKGGSTKWMYGISLLGDTALLVSMIVGDPILNGSSNRQDTPLEAAFWKLFPRFLNRARLLQGDTTEHRLEMWEKMDRISRRIVAEHAQEGRYIDRLSTEHILEVQQRCQEMWPNSKNVNMELRTFRRYFEEFCEGSHETLTEKNEGSIQRTENAIFDTQTRPGIHVCIDRLLREDKNLWAALLVKLGIHPTTSLSAEAFALEQGISRYELDKRHVSALANLTRCFKNSVDMLLRI